MLKNIEKSIIFAPLEGITDSIFRSTVLELFPEWDFVYTDFFRIPPEGKIGHSRLIEHLGKNIYEDTALKYKSPFQVLASPTSQTASCAKVLSELEIPWIDLNCGCPSKKVNAHHGGAWLMDNPDEIKKIIKDLRANFRGRLSVKIRSGFKDASKFDEIIKIIEGEGVDLLTIHPRTKTMMYTGSADWSFIERATKVLKIPIIGNGDIKTVADIYRRISGTGCKGVMIGRGAVGSPQLAANYKAIQNANSSYHFINAFSNKLKETLPDEVTLKRLKSIVHYLLIIEGRSDLLRSKTVSEFFTFLKDRLPC